MASRRIVTPSHHDVAMQTLATTMMLEHLGYDISVPEMNEIDGVELCAALAWVCAIVADVACEGVTTLQGLASERNARATALVCALCDGGEDTLQAAVEVLHGSEVSAACYELIDMSRTLGRLAANRREEARLALLQL